MTTGSVQEILRYPVKSTAGELLDTAEVDDRGLVGDRAWAVYTADGGIASGKSSRRFRRVAGLMAWRSTLDASLDASSGARPAVRLLDPDGTSYAVGEPAADTALTAAFGQPLRLAAETTVPHYDDCGVHLVTTASLRRAGQLAGGPVDARRLRPNLVLDTDGEGFLEDGWTGVELAVGPDVVLRIGAGMPRCVMVDQPQHELPAGSPVLRALGREHDLVLGVQAEVVRGGVLRVGDVARLLGP